MAQDDRLNLTSEEAVKYGIGLATSGQWNKKGNFNMLSNTAKGLVVFGIMVGMGLLILGKFQDATDNTSTAYTEIGNVSALFSDLTVWGGIVLIVIMAYVIMRYLGVFGE